MLYAGTGNQVATLDPVTLVPGAYNTGLIQWSGSASYVIDGNVPNLLPNLQVTSDGRTIAGLAYLNAGQRSELMAAWIAGVASSRKLAALTSTTSIADPSPPVSDFGNLQSGVGVMSSPSHHVAVVSTPSGFVGVYNTRTAAWQGSASLPAGVTAVGIDDAGNYVVRSDGIVVSASGAQVGDLNGVVPAGYVAGGYSITQDGMHGIVYGYQPDPTSGAQPATHGVIWVVDLTQAPAVPIGPSNVLSTVPLASPVGCTSVTLAIAETCAHSASITVTPGSDSVFVLGPRGLAAAALPSGFAVATAAVQRSPHRIATTIGKPAAAQLAWRAVGMWHR